MDFGGTYIAAFVIGLLGGAHCIGMCGGIMAALGFAVPNASSLRRLTILLSYNVGRISSYCLLGFLVGLLGQQFDGTAGLTAMRLVAGGLLIAMGLYLAGWWRGLIYLERAGGYLWRYLQPLSARLMPVTHPLAAVALGAVWGWLPCGLVYSALAYAMAQASAPAAAGVMLAFGLGTLPAVLAGGAMAQWLRQQLQAQRWRVLMALLVITFGVWTLWGAVAHQDHNHASSDHANHAGHVQESSAPVSDTPAESHQHHH